MHDDDSVIDAIVASGVKIPPMPAVLVRLLALAERDETGAREMAALIGRDPALSGAIFRVAGSPVLGLRARVTGLEQAITLLGLRTTLAVARSEGLRAAFEEPALTATLNVLWARMNAAAEIVLACLRLLRLKGLAEDQAFLAAIFHDCGLALLCRRDRDYAKAFQEGRGWPDLASLDAAHATNHTVVGMMVARNWQLPGDVALAIRHHHDHDLAGLPEAARKMIVLVRLACRVLATRAGGEDPEWQAFGRLSAVEVCEAVGQDVDDVIARLR